MNIMLNFKGMILQYIAPYRRQPNRLNWLWSLIDLQPIFDDFAKWRQTCRYKFKVCGQRMVLEEYLIREFGTGIKIISYKDGYWAIGLNSEVAHWCSLGSSLSERLVPVPLSGEGGKEFGGYDFLVMAPHDYDIEKIKAEIERYRLAGKKYKIVTI
jgi:hypothetical protein bfra3_06982